ncbi:hypothetical protein K490DRAFT_58841 [Saccharata proteae CBS 121410]|uniref:Fungal N-terminal domain-containing protein n=1 Tax=Saccharata proteae CBS 121410 TaxID=1314787 RepID=A0A9P4LXQ6_9PEZI|nr:hypothetical protein K490DRAFT_58841 [Saccharata proteae CBS 121410]
MADPLSVTASITGIISLGLTVSSGLVKFVQSARDAPKELETIANDMFALCGIFMKDELEKASSTIRLTTLSGGKVKLSLKERGRFFFRQDSLTKLKTDILQSKTTLMLAMVVADIKKREEAQRNPERDEGAAEERLQMLATMQSLNRKLEDMKVQTPEKSSNILPPKRIMRNVNVDNEAKNRASPPLPSRAISNQANQTLSLGPNSHVAMALANSKKRKEAQRNPERDEAKNPAPPPLPSRAISNQANAGVFLDSNTHKPNVFTNMVAADPFTPLNNNTPVYGKKGLNNQTDDIPEPSPHHRHIQAWTMELDRESYEQNHTMDAPAMAAAAAIPRDHAGFLERPPPARPRKAPTYQDPYGYNYVADRTLEKVTAQTLRNGLWGAEVTWDLWDADSSSDVGGHRATSGWLTQSTG